MYAQRCAFKACFELTRSVHGVSFVCRGAFAQIKISGDFQSDGKTRMLIISVVRHQNVQLN